jgi:hypothetical protein
VPKITLVEVPSLGASAVDHVSGTHLSVGESADVDDASVARFRSVEPLGYHFEVNGAAPAVQGNTPEVGAGEPTTDPASTAAPDAPPVAQ